MYCREYRKDETPKITVSLNICKHRYLCEYMWNGLYKIYYILKLNLAKQNKTDRFAEIQVKFP